MRNDAYFEQKCNVYGCDFGSNPDPYYTCIYCNSDRDAVEDDQ